jgi:very-short-patch-repair endonuclease
VKSHATQADFNRYRTAYLEKAGWSVIRFTYSDLAWNPEGISMAIVEALKGRHS